MPTIVKNRRPPKFRNCETNDTGSRPRGTKGRPPRGKIAEKSYRPTFSPFVLDIPGELSIYSVFLLSLPSKPGPTPGIQPAESLANVTTSRRPVTPRIFPRRSLIHIFSRARTARAFFLAW